MTAPTDDEEFGMTVPALRFRNISKTYAGAGADALSAFTLDIEPGECFGLVGANGAGKPPSSSACWIFAKRTKPTAAASGFSAYPTARPDHARRSPICLSVSTRRIT